MCRMRGSVQNNPLLYATELLSLIPNVGSSAASPRKRMIMSSKHPFKGKARILPSGTFSMYPGPYKPLPRSVLPGWTMLPVHGLAKGQLFAGRSDRAWLQSWVHGLSVTFRHATAWREEEGVGLSPVRHFLVWSSKEARDSTLHWTVRAHVALRNEIGAPAGHGLPGLEGQG